MPLVSTYVDTDGDGIIDSLDRCKNTPGFVKYNGCPVPDSDSDGVNDELDKCLSTAGSSKNSGCPLMNEEAAGKIHLLAKQIKFQTSSAQLLLRSYTALNEIAQILILYAGAPIRVEGHTDNDGTVRKNQLLSEARARAVVMYLINKGVDEKRLIPVGFGEMRPISDNNTDSGKAQNRRVEFVF